MVTLDAYPHYSAPVELHYTRSFTSCTFRLLQAQDVSRRWYTLTAPYYPQEQKMKLAVDHNKVARVCSGQRHQYASSSHDTPKHPNVCDYI